MLSAIKKGKVSAAELGGTVLVLALLAIFMLRWGIEGIVHSRRIQVVPDLRGKSLSGALDLLAPLDLGIKKEGTEFTTVAPIGSILRQKPPAGTKVREGKMIRVVISQGGETVFTPAIAGLPLRNAEMLLRQNQVILGEVTESYSLRLEKGLVVSQDPAAESSVERNSMINVVVSGGAPPEGIILVPELVGKNIAEAEKWAQTHKLKTAVEKDPASRFPYGTIRSQDPSPDTVVAEGKLVKLTISGRRDAGKGQAGEVNFSYQVPQGSSESLVRIVTVGAHGEREEFNGLRAPGTAIDLSLPAAAGVRVKIFLNGTLVKEQDL